MINFINIELVEKFIIHSFKNYKSNNKPVFFRRFHILYIEKKLFRNNGNGISITNSNNTLITNNHANNNYYLGIKIYVSYDNTISHNIANYNSVGATVGGGIRLNPLSERNTIINNTLNYNVVGSDGHGIRLDKMNYIIAILAALGVFFGILFLIILYILRENSSLKRDITSLKSHVQSTQKASVSKKRI